MTCHPDKPANEWGYIGASRVGQKALMTYRAYERTAFSSRMESGKYCKLPIAPPFFCANTVTTPLAAEIAKSGSFSFTSQKKLFAGGSSAAAVPVEVSEPIAAIRRKGQ